MTSTDHEIKSIPQGEDSVLGHDATSLHNWFLTFLKNLVPSSSRVQSSKKNSHYTTDLWWIKYAGQWNMNRVGDKIILQVTNSIRGVNANSGANQKTSRRRRIKLTRTCSYTSLLDLPQKTYLLISRGSSSYKYSAIQIVSVHPDEEQAVPNKDCL